MTIPELESLMQKHNLSQSDLARELGVDRSLVSRALSGEELTGWANAALTQYFAFLEVKELLNVYPIKKK